MIQNENNKRYLYHLELLLKNNYLGRKMQYCFRKYQRKVSCTSQNLEFPRLIYASFICKFNVITRIITLNFVLLLYSVITFSEMSKYSHWYSQAFIALLLFTNVSQHGSWLTRFLEICMRI